MCVSGCQLSLLEVCAKKNVNVFQPETLESIPAVKRGPHSKEELLFHGRNGSLSSYDGSK